MPAGPERSQHPIEVHAWLDIACPWCWIAKRRFETAVAEFGGDVTVAYHSFELAPDLTLDEVSTETAFLQRLHAITADQAAERIRLVSSTGARLGLAYDFGAVQHTSTFRAHQLLQLGTTEGVQDALLEALFSAFFEQGRDLRQIEELVLVGAGAGLDPVEVRRALETEEYAAAVSADRELAGAYQVTSIPTYVLPDQPPIHGAKRPGVLVEALRRVEA